MEQDHRSSKIILAIFMHLSVLYVVLNIAYVNNIAASPSKYCFRPTYSSVMCTVTLSQISKPETIFKGSETIKSLIALIIIIVVNRGHIFSGS